MVRTLSDNPIENRWWNLCGTLGILYCDERIVKSVSSGIRVAACTALESPDWTKYVREMFRPKICQTKDGRMRMRKYGLTVRMYRLRTPVDLEYPPLAEEPLRFEIAAQAVCAVKEGTRFYPFDVNLKGAFKCWTRLVLYSKCDFRFWRDLQPTWPGPQRPLRQKAIYWNYADFSVRIMMDFHTLSVAMFDIDLTRALPEYNLAFRISPLTATKLLQPLINFLQESIHIKRDLKAFKDALLSLRDDYDRNWPCISYIFHLH